ncbi:unnamed protein product [Owenia fusiformis]|uniref:nucleoside diphosphate phosphatase n=1 Tax=Owenia fusiformis TaxID=6347 RepID=A0A8J1U593_OWEFU|nr:unnamed protein product [Owenia fusiformis]
MRNMLFFSGICAVGVTIGAVLFMYNRKMARQQNVALATVVLAVGCVVIVTGYYSMASYNRSKQYGFQGLDNTQLSTDYSRKFVDSSISESINVKIMRNRTKADQFYGIMFDAGSTGSRIHVYKFVKLTANSTPELVDELFEQVKPGLSSYAHEPTKGAESFIPMLENAKKWIPKDKWPTTPLDLKATAGLRLLPGTAADSLLRETRNVLASYPFQLVEDVAAIMGGNDEGIFSWYTVNFLLGKVADIGKSVGVMDLGGGSTQITFLPLAQSTLDKAPKDYFGSVNVFGKKHNLYTHSYLGLGLMSARLEVMGGLPDSPKNEQNKVENTLSSSCLPPNFTGPYTHGNTDYIIKGQGHTHGFDACSFATKNVVKKYKLHVPEEVKSMPFFAISYYRDRAVDAQLVDEEDGGDVKVGDFFNAAQKICSDPHPKEPLLCLDLCYITSLLEGIGFQPSAKITIQKKINRKEISWSLGATFDMLGKSS